jgi:hypothetical protein
VVEVTQQWASARQTDGTFSADYNFLAQFNSGQFTTVQSVLVDNNTVPYEVLLTEVETGQRIRVPPFAQGLYPVLAASSPKFRAVLSAVPDPTTGTVLPFLGTTTFFFLNTQQAPFETKQLAQGENFQSVSSVATTWTTSINVLPALGGNLHYALSGFSLSLVAGFIAGYPSGRLVAVSLGETSSGLWADLFSAPAGGGTLYERQVVFDPPIITRNPASPVILATGELPTGSMSGAYTIQYGIVTIQ